MLRGQVAHAQPPKLGVLNVCVAVVVAPRPTYAQTHTQEEVAWALGGRGHSMPKIGSW